MTASPQIVVIDDDPLARESVRLLLEAKGFCVIAHADGREALHWLLANEPPDIILLDIRIPQLSAWNLWAQMRFMPRVAAVPVIMVSRDARAMAQARAAGAAGVLLKPFSSEELSGLIDAVLQPSAPASSERRQARSHATGDL